VIVPLFAEKLKKRALACGARIRPVAVHCKAHRLPPPRSSGCSLARCISCPGASPSIQIEAENWSRLMELNQWFGHCRSCWKPNLQWPNWLTGASHFAPKHATLPFGDGALRRLRRV